MNAQERRVEELEQREQSVIIAVSTDPASRTAAKRLGASGRASSWLRPTCRSSRSTISVGGHRGADQAERLEQIARRGEKDVMVAKNLRPLDSVAGPRRGERWLPRGRGVVLDRTTY